MQAVERPGQRRWAPWWLYVVAIGATSLVPTQLLQPDGWPTWLEVAAGVGSMAVVAALITLAYRLVRA